MKKSLLLSLAAILPAFVWGQANTTTLTSYGYSSGVSGLYSSYFGINSGSAATSGSTNNCFFGMYSGLKTTGSENTFLGRSSGINNSTGSYNTYIGTWSGQNNIVGSKNTFIGNLAGYNNIGSNNVFIGYSAGYNETGSNKLYIDNSNTATPLIYGDFATDLLTVNGSLGIGTNAPNDKLDVSGNIRASIFKDRDNINYYMDLSNSGVSLKTAGSLFLPYGENLYFGSTASANTEYFRLFNVSDGNAYIEYTENLYIKVPGVVNSLTLSSIGNVGIGATNPGAKLDVNGKIRCEEVEVIADVPASDFVFEPEYQLKSLSEVETFVKENKHLPEIPSAAEFKENGYKVGEMDDLLLRKIEQLTLYIIEQEKRIQELESQVNVKK
jgi:hypothetical protein